MPDIEREEVGIIGGVAVLGLLWSFVAVPYLSSTPWFLNLYPLWAYLLYNIGWILAISVIFGGLVEFVVSEDFSVGETFRIGLSSWLGVSLIFDMLQPPLYLSTSGQILIPLGTSALENVAVDATAATLWQNLLGGFVYGQLFGVSSWFVLTYVVTPVIALVVMAFLLSPKKFVGLFEDAL